MRLVKPSATVIAALALWVGAGVGAFAQAKQAPPKPTPTPKAVAAPKAAPAKQQAAPPAKAEAKAKAPAKAKAEAKAPAKRAKKAESKAATKPASSKKVVTAVSVKRDPFQPLVSRGEPGKGPADEDLGPGPSGVRVSALRLDGVVRAPSGMIAVITTPRQRVYFIREGTRLYDGVVEKISLDSITLRERGQDPFGKPLDRQVIKRLYPRAGEQ